VGEGVGDGVVRQGGAGADQMLTYVDVCRRMQTYADVC
jgi:hypothetical protein